VTGRSGITMPLRGLLFAAMLLARPALADMYVWKDPDTGKTRMTNIVPPWLREPVPGKRMPRVEVVRDNKVIDPGTALANPQRPPEPVSNPAAKAGAGTPAASVDDD
jgi:hypothetical protein